MEVNHRYRFRLKKEHPYTKQITVLTFSVFYNGVAAESFQQDVSDAISKLGNQHLDHNETTHIKTRKHDIMDEKLVIFFSWYDDKINISTTETSSSDEITSKEVDNADICHLFIAIKDNKIWAFSTISTLNIDKRLTDTISKLLNTSCVSIVNEVDNDNVEIIKKEKIKHIEIAGNFDLLSLGFPKSNFLSKFGAKEQNNKHLSKQKHYGVMILGKKGVPQIIKNMEDSPATALNYLETDAELSNNDIYIVTGKNRKINGKNLKKRDILYITPNGKTNTAHWSDVCNVFYFIDKLESISEFG